MSYEIRYASGVERDMSRLPRKALAQIDAAIVGLVNNPRPSGCKKLGGRESLWRIRVGDYRIVYGIDDAHKAIDICIVAQRQDVYRGL